MSSGPANGREGGAAVGPLGLLLETAAKAASRGDRAAFDEATAQLHAGLTRAGLRGSTPVDVMRSVLVQAVLRPKNLRLRAVVDALALACATADTRSAEGRDRA